ncbi:hypothetical protein [Methylorubrum extorquens]|uniref:Uncharacterized protein n=1 Tax=Methylorubrum extorquens DSM 13060 TaxID=882800 RepID=H1KFP7_METEX|nr:hypothetical protein [Methylorubrum extorquens]EHP93628.1 hypothetical protein MetexDRAFT_1459 [Methylorubrum extorquens DSM 13060]
MDASVLMGLASAVMGMAGGGMGGGYDRGYGPRFDPYAGERYGAVSRRYDDAGFGYGSGPRRDYGRYGYDRGYGVRPQARYAGYGTMVCATMRGSCRTAAAYPGQSCGCQDASGRYVPGTAR